MVNGWERSAEAWIADMGETGDFSRRYILDDPMMERVRAAGPRTALDVGCGEGRFCRMLAAAGVAATGIEPTRGLREAARARDPGGAYADACAEAMPFADGAFDMVVSYLTLVDIEDLAAGYTEMLRVLRPGGRLLIANLSGYATALPDATERNGWLRREDGGCVFACDHYHRERAFWIGWRGIRVRNFHRPLEAYIDPLLAAGLRLTHFAEPAPMGGPEEQAARYLRAPVFVIMEWQKPEG